MKPIFRMPAAPIDANAIQATIERALAAAGLNTQSGPMSTVTETIRNALSAAGVSETLSRHPESTASPGAEIGQVIDVEARVIGVEQDQSPNVAPSPSGRFEMHRYANSAGARAYKLYVPAQLPEAPALLVMLHGCTQSADDFAAGTRMNALADAHGFLVAYPEQPASANPSKCWNWFNAADQRRDVGEPSLIAGIVREVAGRHGVDGRRVFVAGLSAGAAMAVILGETYPDLFAALGVHSGLPYASAHDVPSAMAAMKGGRSGMPGLAKASGVKRPARATLAHAVPAIVFHGDRDHTVQATNGSEITRQAREAHLAAHPGAAQDAVTQQAKAGGRSYSKAVHADADGRPFLEFWTLHGAGHAWSGGSPTGSFTDRSGPDASAEMVRFFLGLTGPGAA